MSLTVWQRQTFSHSSCGKSLRWHTCSTARLKGNTSLALHFIPPKGIKSYGR